MELRTLWEEKGLNSILLYYMYTLSVPFFLSPIKWSWRLRNYECNFYPLILLYYIIIVLGNDFR